MNIPVTDKLWVKCKFDENFNEVSYIDNKGLSYEFINPVTGELKFYKNTYINISQELIDHLKKIKPDNEIDELFLYLFFDLRLIKYFKFQNNIMFKNIVKNKIVMEYCVRSGFFWISNSIWSEFKLYYQNDNYYISQFFNHNLYKFLNINVSTHVMLSND